jgi:hypothetical protein
VGEAGGSVARLDPVSRPSSSPAAVRQVATEDTGAGGTQWSKADSEKVLRETGFVEVRSLPTPPGGMITMIVGRKPA